VTSPGCSESPCWASSRRVDEAEPLSTRPKPPVEPVPVRADPVTTDPLVVPTETELITSEEGESAQGAPSWTHTAPSLELSSEPEPLPPLEPLLTPRWARGVLTTLLALEVDEGPLDVERVIERLVRREPMHRMPRESLRTLRRGVQVLLDRSEAMELFSRDQAHLIERLETVMGRSRMEVLDFIGCPSRGASTGPRPPLRHLPAYQPPAGNVPLLLVTDLGIGASIDSAGEEEWLQFVHEMHRRGHSLFALVPHPPERWPRRLLGHGRVRIVPWDRPTTAGTVRAASKLMSWRLE
jgi:hypothetical protein